MAKVTITVVDSPTTEEDDLVTVEVSFNPDFNNVNDEENTPAQRLGKDILNFLSGMYNEEEMLDEMLENMPVNEETVIQ